LAQAVAELLQDNGEALMQQLGSQEGGAGTLELKDVFAGKSCVKITPMQLYQREIPGWKYKIVEKPNPGEYRYVRFAWKAPGAKGIMLQMHDEKDWNIRFTAGIDERNWGTKFVDKNPPEKWTLVTRDLFEEFGERTIQGIALTVFGQPGYFDHIYFGATIDDLDRIDATGLRDGPAPALDADDMVALWRNLADRDASKEYRAFWTLVAAPDKAVDFLRPTLLIDRSPEAIAQIKKWMVELDADEFQVRERASRMLEQHLDAAAPLLKKELEQVGPEARVRIEELLQKSSVTNLGLRRREKALRALKYMETRPASGLLEDLSRAQRAQ
jgi:hypothetical protein